MSIGPLKSLLAGAAAVGFVAGPLTGNAVAQKAEVVPVSAIDATQTSLANDFGRADEDNIGVLLLYGTGNRTAPNVAAGMVVDALESAADRRGYYPNIESYVERVDNFEGIIVIYAMGSGSIEGVDIREAIKEPTAEQPNVISDSVIERRLDINRTVDFALKY